MMTRDPNVFIALPLSVSGITLAAPFAALACEQAAKDPGVSLSRREHLSSGCHDGERAVICESSCRSDAGSVAHRNASASTMIPKGNATTSMKTT